MVYIGEKLREVRGRRLITQEELAEKAGISPSTVVNIERHQAQPHFSTIRKLARAFEIESTELLGE